MLCTLSMAIAAVASKQVSASAKCGPEANAIGDVCVSVYPETADEHEETALVHPETADEHEDTALLQTKAVSHTVTKHAKTTRNIHRFSIHEHDDAISMLQGGHTTDSQVYRLCALDDAGFSDDSEDEFGTTTESCGNLTVTNEAGEVGGTVYGCIPASVGEGDCLALVESADFFEHAGENQVRKASLQADSPDASDVLLVEIPTLTEINFFKAMQSIEKQLLLFPGAVVLFQGKGGQRAAKHMSGFLCLGFCFGLLFFGGFFGFLMLVHYTSYEGTSSPSL